MFTFVCLFAVFCLIYCCKICSHSLACKPNAQSVCAFILAASAPPESILSHLHNARRRANSSAKTIHPEFEAVKVSLEICSPLSARGRKTRPPPLFRQTAPTLCPAVLRRGRDKRVKYVEKRAVCAPQEELGAACLYIRFVSFYKIFFSPRRNLRE